MQSAHSLPEQSLFPRSACYNREWVVSNSIGENVLYNLESLTQVLRIEPGMRVLDLACGRAVSSIFMAREFDVQVWAIDSAVPATDNYRRICENGCENKVFPLQADARRLPFPKGFFDLVVVIDSYTYFGTDDKYLPYLCKFLKPEGQIGLVDVCFRREIETFEQVPAFLRPDYQSYWYFVHAIDWWKKLWEKTGLVRVTVAEELPQANFIRREYIQDYKDASREPFAKAIARDTENTITFFRLVGQRTGKGVKLQEYGKQGA
jgi:cyclopropane fatty-acyl-phospholipid synthase-like methyltransferase